MKQFFATIFVLFYCLNLSYATPPCLQSEKAYIWKLEHKQTTLYVLGSIHVFKEKWYPLNPVIEDAYKQSDYLAVEIDITTVDSNAVLGKMLKRATLPKNQTLDDLYPKSFMKKLKQQLIKQAIPYPLVKRMQPWMVEVFISMNLVKSLGYSEQSGIDLHFINQAKNKKKIIALETLESQLQALSSSKLDMQAARLKSTVEQLDEIDSVLSDMICAWFRGDAKGLMDAATEGDASAPEVKDFLQRVNTDRNISMVEKIVAFNNKPGRYFIVVGALHLGGETGIIQLLKNKGFSAEQLNNR
jgi:uncharacterized protein